MFNQHDPLFLYIAGSMFVIVLNAFTAFFIGKAIKFELTPFAFLETALIDFDLLFIVIEESMGDFWSAELVTGGGRVKYELNEFGL